MFLQPAGVQAQVDPSSVAVGNSAVAISNGPVLASLRRQPCPLHKLVVSVHGEKDVGFEHALLGLAC